MSHDIFNPSQLLYEMMQHESMGLPARTAMRTLGSHLRLHSFSANRKTFTFQVQSNKTSTAESSSSAFLTLQVVKGSLHTLIWSTFARFDDEYALFFHLNETDIYSNTGNVYLVWSVKGVDAVNSKISAGLIDWFVLRRIQAILKIPCIGVLAFAKILGRFLLSVPNFLKMKKYLPPMPATFMFNYLMVVCYCPFELSVPKVSRLLDLGPDPSTGFVMKRLLQTLIQPNGSGSWLLGYLPVRVAVGGYVLQSKYYFQQGDAPQEEPTEEGLARPASTTVDPPRLPPFSSLPSFSSIQSEKDSEPVSDSENARSYSKQCARLIMETAVRVVELLPHPLGRRELVVVLEFVHNNQWSANTRFVSLDVFKIGQAILLAGQPPPQFLSKLDIMDKTEWEQRVRDYEAATTLVSGATLLGGGVNTLHRASPLTTPAPVMPHHSAQVGCTPLPSPFGSPLLGSLSAFNSPLPSNFDAGALLRRLGTPAATSATTPVAGGAGGGGVRRTGEELGVLHTVSMDTQDDRAAPSAVREGLRSSAAAAADSPHNPTGAGQRDVVMSTDSSSSTESSGDDHDSADFIIENIPRSSSTSRRAKNKTNTKKGEAVTLAAAAAHNAQESFSNAEWVESEGKKKNYVDFIDFENSCEWGAPYLTKKNNTFYVDLVSELMQLPRAASSSADDLSNVA